MTSTKITISWSEISTYMKCPKRHDYHYNQGLTPVYTSEDLRLILGSAFHAGMEHLLSLMLLTDSSWQDALPAAKDAARQYVRDQETQFGFQVENQAVLMLDFYVPQIGLGTKWFPVTRGEVLGNDFEAPAVEWEFTQGAFRGTIDAVLRSSEGEYVIVDWKTRKTFPADDLVDLDGQLPLYATILNKMGANITQVIMWQFKTALPKPAEIGVKGLPLTGRASYDTTWEAWVASLPDNINPEKYREELQGKLKQPADYMRPIETAVTRKSSNFALSNALDVMSHMEQHNIPRVLSSTGCAFCPFKRLCAAERYGGDISELKEVFYLTDVDE